MTEVKEASALYEDGKCIYCAPLQRMWPGEMCIYHSNDEAAYSAYRITGLPYLREERLAKGMSVDELSIVSGLAEFSIKEIEAGRRRARFKSAHALAEALGVPLGQLTGEED
jgi:hypothetical protein